MNLIKIFLLSYLILNITGQTNDLTGTYIFSSAWSGGSTSITNCLPISVDVDIETSNEAFFDWEFPGTAECQDEGFSSNYDTEADFYDYAAYGNFTGVSVWEWGPTIGAYYSFSLSPFMMAYFFSNKSMILYLDNEENYLFIANFSTYQEDNFSSQTNGSATKLETLDDLQLVSGYITQAQGDLESLNWDLSDPEAPPVQGKSRKELIDDIKDEQEDLQKMDNIQSALKKGLKDNLEDFEYLEYLESVKGILEDDEEELNANFNTAINIY